MDRKKRSELSRLLNAERKRLQLRGIEWDVADVMEIVEAVFAEAPPKPRLLSMVKGYASRRQEQLV